MITAPSSTALDYSGARPPLPRSLTHLWSVQVPFAIGHTRLCSWDGRAILVRPGEGLQQIGDSPSIETWPVWSANLSSAGPGWRSDPVMVTDDGRVLRVQAAGGVTETDRVDPPGSALSVIGLPEGRVLLKAYPENGGAWFELRAGAPRWHKEGAAPDLLPHERTLFRARDGAIECLDLESGDAIWTSPGPLKRIIGVVESSLWVVAADSRIAAIDTGTGRVTRTVAATNNRALSGRLDDRGLFHTTTGLRYQIYDLSGEGTLVADHELKGSTTAIGELACVAADGRLVFGDDDGNLYVFDPAAPAPLTPLWRQAQPIANPVIANHRLYVLQQGTLLCFG